MKYRPHITFRKKVREEQKRISLATPRVWKLSVSARRALRAKGK